RAKLAAAGPSVRVNWRTRTRLTRVSAADVFADGEAICREAGTPMPDLKGRTVLVGYTAAGLNDAKPTPVDARMPGVEVWGEATEALLSGSAIWMPPAWFKYLIAALLVLLTAFVFYRGEPTSEIDQIFVATNLLLLSIAFVGLTAFGVFFDIFAAVGFVSLCFGFCRLYAGVQRGYATGNDDFRPEFDPQRHPALALARLRFAPDTGMDAQAGERRLREYRRRLRRFLQADSTAVSVEHVVERKSWLWESMNDLTVLIWPAEDVEAAAAAAVRELDDLHRHLADLDEVLADDGCVRLACTSTARLEGETQAQTRARIRGVLGELLQTHAERPLSARNAVSIEAT
ncbi:MAG TPA: CHASE2 domain-containing protein, partial [Xanthomonadaceae bacterium]|nr:CHASE2 domain-containing protein [Xanthomonadaceae bacterium]